MADHSVVPGHPMLDIDGMTGASGDDFLFLAITLTEIVATANRLAWIGQIRTTVNDG